MVDATIRSRADELIAEMTTAEKAGQLTQYFYFGFHAGSRTPRPSVAACSCPAGRRPVEAALGRGEVGSLLFVTGAGRDQPAAAARARRQPARHPRALRLRRDPRLPHHPPGADRDGGLLGPGDDRARAGGRRAGGARRRHPLDLRADGRHRPRSALGPHRRGRRRGPVPRRGRSPPPRCAASRAKGIGTPERVIAGPKHFAGYGAALGGRDYDEVNLSDYELWNVYFPPFKAALDAGAGNVMTAYMDLNGVPADRQSVAARRGAARRPGASRAWSSPTPTPSAISRRTASPGISPRPGARALNAGCDMEMAIADPAYAHLPEAVARGGSRGGARRRASGGCWRPSCAWACSTTPFVDEERAREVLNDPAHREVARARPSARRCCCATRATCCRSTPARLGSLAVDRPAGRLEAGHARAVVLRLRSRRDGDGARRHPRQGRGPGDRSSTRPASARRSGPSRRCSTCSAATRRRTRRTSTTRRSCDGRSDLARAADVAVVVVGEWQNMIGEAASRSSLELPGRQLELLQAVVATGTPVVLLVMNGRPLDLRWAAEHVPAILDIWYPGTQGGAAVANLLVRRRRRRAASCRSPGRARSGRCR